MSSFLIIPAIDLRGGRCVRLRQGRKDATTVYDRDPVEVAQGFERDGAAMIHVVDLDGAFSEANSRNREVLADIVRAVQIPVQFGGGMRSVDAVAKAIDLGVNRAVIGTAAVEAPELLAELLARFGGARIAVGIDARAGLVLTRGWVSETNISAATLAQKVAEAGVERVIYTDVHRDGMFTGPNIEQTKAIAKASGLKVTASGGVSSLDDLRELGAAETDGIDSVIVGKALHDGRFTLNEGLHVVGD